MSPTTLPVPLATNDLVGRWILDSNASVVQVTHRTMWGLVRVKGRFTSIRGEGAVDEQGGVTGSMSIEAASIDTGNRKRDEHLRSADFFDVERHPIITIGVTSMAVRENLADLPVVLAIRGASQPVTVQVAVEAQGQETVTFRTEGRLDPGVFGITWNRLRMMKGPTTFEVAAVFRREAR